MRNVARNKVRAIHSGVGKPVMFPACAAITQIPFLLSREEHAELRFYARQFGDIFDRGTIAFYDESPEPIVRNCAEWCEVSGWTRVACEAEMERTEI